MPDIIIHENVASLDWCLLEELFGEEYAVQCRRFNPSDVGYPANRPRVYSLLVLKSRLEIQKPYDGPAFTQAMFRDVKSDANLYFKQ